MQNWNLDNVLKVVQYAETPGCSDKIFEVLKSSGQPVEIHRFNQLSQVLDFLEGSSVDIIIAEHILPSPVPLQILSFLQQRSLEIPYVLVTNFISEESALELFLHGADDYVLSDRLYRLSLILKKLRERRRLQEEKVDLKSQLQSNEKRFRAIIEHGADVVMVMDSARKITYVSPSIERVLGYTHTEAIDFKRESIFHHEDIDLFESQYKLSLGQPGSVVGPFEIRIFDKESKCRWFQAKFNNLLHVAEVGGTVLYFQDIGSQKEAEKVNFLTSMLLEDERGRFYELLSNAPAGMGILSGPNHVFQMINSYYYEMIGKKDVIGLPLAEALPHLGKQGFISMLDGVYKTGKTATGLEMKATVFDHSTGDPIDIYINFIFQAYRNLQGDIEGTFFFINNVTEQVLSRQVVEESERRYKQIVETAQEGIWLINEFGITVFVNKKLCEILGFEEQEILGAHYTSFLARGYGEDEMLQWERSESRQFDMQFFTKAGAPVWTTISSNSMYDDDGEYRGTMAMVSDITDKKKLEELLEKATTMARIGSFEVDMLSNKLFWSNITREIHEVAVDAELDFDTATRFFKEGLSRDLVQNSFRATFTKGTPLDLEVQIVTAKGNERWVRLIAEAEFINGQCSKMYGSIQDIDAQKNVEIELLRTINEKEDILESIGDGFITVDREWRVTYWNKMAEIFAQVKKSEILGNILWDTVPHLIDSPLYLPFQKAMSTRTVQQAEAIYKPTNRWYDNTVFPSPTGLSIFFRDITERKESDIKLMELNEELRKYTSELIISNKELEQFSYIISHNLRAPVANIKGLLEAMDDDSNPEEVQRTLRESLSLSVHALDDVITDLNSILKVKTEVKERKEQVGFDPLIQQIQASVQNIIREEHVTIETDFREVAELFTLKSFLYSIFYNLILNSIKYRQSDKPPVIRVRSAVEEGHIVVYFSDNGMGIDLSRGSEEIFGLYKRYHTHKEGKGLGLFMVKSQMATLGGSITVKSEVNYGTEFKLVFPFKN